MRAQTISHSGRLTYATRWLVVNLGKDFGEYYYSLIPKAKRTGLNRPLYPAHITVVRFKYETPDYSNWGFLDGAAIPFEYSPALQEDSLYLYLDVWSPMIGVVRRKLGLPTFIHERTSYHITIANKKGGCRT